MQVITRNVASEEQRYRDINHQTSGVHGGRHSCTSGCLQSCICHPADLRISVRRADINKILKFFWEYWYQIFLYLYRVLKYSINITNILVIRRVDRLLGFKKQIFDLVVQF